MTLIGLFRSVARIFQRISLPFFLWIWMFGFFIFELQVLSFGQPNPLVTADAIVVFTGSHGRLQTAIDLLKKGAAPRLLVSGTPVAKEGELIWGDQNLPMTFDQAPNTKANVFATVSWARSLNVKSIYLVTWNQHMPRCLLLFKRAHWPGKIIVFPVVWETPDYLFYSFLEYHKFLIFLGLGE